MTALHTASSFNHLAPAMSRSLDTEFSLNGMGLTTSTHPRRKMSPEQDFVGARSAWANRPHGHAMDRDAARSRSPVPADKQTFTLRSRTPSNPSRPPPVPRYHYIPREYHSPPKLRLQIPPSQRPVPAPPSHRPSTKNALDLLTTRLTSTEGPRPEADIAAQQSSQLSLRTHRSAPRTAQANLVPRPLNVRSSPARQSREHIDSMVDYLSMEQLESLWQSQDMYLGTVIAPQPTSPPAWRIPDGSRTPITSVHPAFRNDPQNDPNYASLACY